MKLTPQEYNVAECVSRGLHDKEIAVELCLTPGTVRVYVHRALTCNHLQNRTQLAVAFVRGEFEVSRRPPNSHPKPVTRRPPHKAPVLQPSLPAHRVAYLQLLREDGQR